MRKWIGWLLAAALASVSAHAGADVKWGTDLEAAKRTSRQSGKPILIDFTAEWCGPCQMMAKETFPNPRVKALLDRVERVQIDIDRAPALAQAYGVNSIPRLVLLPSGGGKPTMDLMGYRPAPDFAAELRAALGMPPDTAVAAPVVSGELDRARAALQAGRWAAFKAADPKAAAAGLSRLVESLGAVTEAEYAANAALLRKAGGEAVPALLLGLQDRHLAVRAGAFRALRELSGERAGLPAFDPWAKENERTRQVGTLRSWWKRQAGTARQ